MNQVNQSINLLALKDKNNTSFCAKLSARISSRKITSFPLFIVYLLHIVFLPFSLSLSCWLGNLVDHILMKILIQRLNMSNKLIREEMHCHWSSRLGKRRAEHKTWPHMSDLVEEAKSALLENSTKLAHMLLRTRTLTTIVKRQSSGECRNLSGKSSCAQASIRSSQQIVIYILRFGCVAPYQQQNI